MKRIVAGLIIGFCLVGSAQAAHAKTVHLHNILENADVDVLITPVGTTETRTVSISKNGSSDFSFEGSGQFLMQYRPKDKPSGTNPVITDLTPFDNKDFNVGGEIGKVTHCYTYRHHRRCRCCCYTVDGERIAILIDATSPDGKPFSQRLPLMYY